MNTFKTLLLREWMQHHRGWLIAMAAPLVIYLLALTFGQVSVGGPRDMPPPTVVILGVSVGMIAATAGIVLLIVLFQAPGLARRDHSDRSIEFWLSLPTSALKSVSATLAAHWVALPLVALAVGLLAGLVLGPLTVLRVYGSSGLAEVHWGSLLAFGLAMWLRLSFGLLLALLWLSPLILGLMAAGAWLKRWGAPAFIGSLFGLHAVLMLAYQNPIVERSIEALFQNAQRAVLAAGGEQTFNQVQIDSPQDVPRLLSQFIPLLGGDAVDAVGNLASPLFFGGLLFAAAAFAAIVYKRRIGN